MPYAVGSRNRCGASALSCALLFALVLAPHRNEHQSFAALGAVPGESEPGATAVAIQLRKVQTNTFVPNHGQWDAQAQFLARSPGVDSWVTERGVVYDFHETRVQGLQYPTPNTLHSAKRRGHVVRMEFLGGRPSPSRGEGLLEGKHNYFVGDESKWASNVPRYSEVRSERVYDGIEARWYFDQGRPRYDLIVAPGADPAKIQMRFEGAQGVSGGKSLKLGTSLGEVEHKGLFAYQKIGGTTKQVPASFVVRGNVAGFEVGAYDRSKPLVIDPLLWSTFLGGNSSDHARSVVVDENGCPIVTGYTASATFPVTPGAYDTDLAQGFDAFVTRLTADGSALSWSTFLGGIGSDGGTAIVQAAGEVFVSGFTNSTDFPIAPVGGIFDPIDSDLNGGYDVFVARLSSLGSQLVYSTYLGGSGFDWPDGIALDSSLSVAVVGDTESPDFPVSGGAVDAVFYGYSEAFVSHVSDDGTELLGSTFLGGSDDEAAYGVAFDDVSWIVLVGETKSTDFPTTPGCFDSTFNGGTSDAFLARLAYDCTALSYSTLLGGSAADGARGVVLDGSSNPVLTGLTYSPNFPTSLGSYDPTHNGNSDAFVTKMKSDGSSQLFSTFVGGTGADYALAIMQTSEGIVAVGETDSPQFPTSLGAIDTQVDGVNDGFVVKLSPDASQLLYGSYFGGTDIDRPFAVAPDAAGNAVVVGETESADFPTTAGSFDGVYGGGQYDAFVCAIPTALVLTAASVPKNEFVGGFSVPLTVTLSHAASPGDVDVAIQTDTPGKVFVSPTKVKAGKNSRVVGIRTETVKVPTPVTVTASRNGVSKTVTFTLVPGGLLSLKLTPTSLSSFQTGSGKVLLSAPAPTGGRSVRLRSGNALLLYVPTEVAIPAGIDGAVFPTFAGPIPASTSVTVTATLGSMNKTATLTVSP